MVKRFYRSKKRLVGAAIISVVLAVSLTGLWQTGQVAEAAIMDPHPGLVGWWRFDEGTGNIAEDSSGYGNDGTIYGATWVDGKYGKALSFDGSNDYVDCGTDSSLDTSILTISFWVIPDSVPASSLALISKQYSWAHMEGWTIYQDTVDGSMRFKFGNGTTVFTHTDADSLYAGVWNFITVVVDGETVKFYRNGIETYSVAETHNIAVSTYPLKIAKVHTGNWFKGIIDEWGIYNRALSAAEIQEIFQKGSDFSSRLLAKVPKGTTQFIVTLSWQGDGSINITIESPSENYTEDMVPVYQKTVYSSSSGDMLNIKRLAVSVTALSSDENWYIALEFDDVEDYRITVEV